MIYFDRNFLFFDPPNMNIKLQVYGKCVILFHWLLTCCPNLDSTQLTSWIEKKFHVFIHK
jgi:hypothetical protein